VAILSYSPGGSTRREDGPEDAFATIILGEGEVVGVAMVSLERAMAMAVS